MDDKAAVLADVCAALVCGRHIFGWYFPSRVSQLRVPAAATVKHPDNLSWEQANARARGGKLRQSGSFYSRKQLLQVPPRSVCGLS
jgi:hypothetical protein